MNPPMNDGGQAFPLFLPPSETGGHLLPIQWDMTMRDWLAGQIASGDASHGAGWSLAATDEMIQKRIRPLLSHSRRHARGRPKAIVVHPAVPLHIEPTLSNLVQSAVSHTFKSAPTANAVKPTP